MSKPVKVQARQHPEAVRRANLARVKALRNKSGRSAAETTELVNTLADLLLTDAQRQ